MSIIQISHQVVDQNAEKSEDVWKRLNDLTKLSKLKIIPKPEYEVRKQQLVDELTGTQIKGGKGEVDEEIAGAIPVLKDATQQKQSVAAGTVTMEKHKGNANRETKSTRMNLPDFTDIRGQRAKVLSFNLDEGRFDDLGEMVQIKIDPRPFARGNLRLAHHMVACLSEEDKRKRKMQSYVAKISIDPFEDPKTYLDDVATQQCARVYAKMYNMYRPPKNVDFVDAYILALIDRPRSPLCAVEPYIDGTYKKHNNNWGFINNKHERNTPHAFSHFTYEASQHQLLICDIQGVGDLYTDPQIHSIDGSGFGKGNMGTRGFKKFFSTHRCNAICRFLKLPLINPKPNSQELLTRPQKALMEGDKVKKVDLAFTGSLETLPTLPAFKNSESLKKKLLHKEEQSCCRCNIV